jgi:pyridinium-3,5-biscarboxylic acid mononucleotide sulfurtransferase
LVTTTLSAKKDALRVLLTDMGAAVVAYSGGVDSAFLMACAHEALGPAAVAVTAISPSLPERARRDAVDLAAQRGWQHQLVPTHEVGREEYARNHPDRCYWCKTELYEVLAPLARRREATMLVGTNLDDLEDIRPGHRAAREGGVRAPLVEAELTKSDVRRLSRAIGLATADKPAAPCLSSRFAYGVRVTEEGLRRIDRAEDHLHDMGFKELRVRDHGDLARIEVPSGEVARAAALASSISAALKDLGFRFVTLDLEGFRSGSLNEVLPLPKIEPGGREA